MYSGLKMTSRIKDLDRKGYILLPERIHGNYSYPDLLVSIGKCYSGKIWYKAQELLNQNNLFMITIRQYIDLMDLLTSNKIFDGNGKRIGSSKLTKNLALKSRGSSEWLDASFKVISGMLYINYNHRFINDQLIPQNSEPLEDCLMEDSHINLSGCNKQGMPTLKGNNLEYWAPLYDNNSVAQFWSLSKCNGIACNRDPNSFDSSCEVRAVKIRE